jgi:two-component system sensor histidine kinase BaeS
MPRIAVGGPGVSRPEPNLRIAIGHRLFVSVLLAILLVAATGIVLMRQNVLRSFAEYASNIELDRLDELSNALAQRYQTRRGWDFLSAGAVQHGRLGDHKRLRGYDLED